MKAKRHYPSLNTWLPELDPGAHYAKLLQELDEIEEQFNSQDDDIRSLREQRRREGER